MKRNLGLALIAIFVIVLTVLLLPTSMAKRNESSVKGQPIKLRWRAATDDSAIAAGAADVRIDNIAITGSSFVSATAAANTALIISEFSEQSFGYVEFYNNGNTPITVATSDASAGWALVSSDPSDPNSSDGITRFVIPNGTVIPARGHYLAAGPDYSLGAYATPDITFATLIAKNTGLALFNSAATLTLANRLDAVGFLSDSALYKEGAGLLPYNPFSPVGGDDYAFYRNMETGLPTDTDDSVADFKWVNTDGTHSQGIRRLGSPGPENLASPIHNTTGAMSSTRIDPSVATSANPNFVFDNTSGPFNGTITIRRTFTNNTGAPITKLRFHVVDLSTLSSQLDTADLRVLTSTGNAVPIGGPNPACPGNVCSTQALTLEPPPHPSYGGGFNSSLGANTVTLGTPLPNGSGINVNFLLGLVTSGCYRFVIIAEALPGGVSTVLGLSGSAGAPGSCTGDPPTAAPAMISGQVTTPDGAPLAGVTMNLSGARSARAITDSNGNYRFRNIDTDNFYTVTPALVNYHFGPESRSFSLLANITDAVFTATRDAVISGNAIDTADFFVRQHYLDFLGREPDESGFNFWSDQILSCGSDAACIERRTINVSTAYFLSIEFQETGGLVDGLYRASYDRRPQYAEFMPDTATVAQGVVVGDGDWAGRLAANKQAFVEAWVQRPAFQSAYGGLGNGAYVDTLISHTGVSFSQSERETLVSGLNSGTTTRADVLRQLSENDRFVSAKRNATFVMMQYFGYLRRDPDESGYRFWLNKLNQFESNFEQAEMVKAFLVSGEYRGRFRL